MEYNCITIDMRHESNMKKQQSKNDRGLAVRREVVRFLGTTVRVAGGAACEDTDTDRCTGCTNCTGETGCTNSWIISY
jgi:hypothetical protein